MLLQWPGGVTMLVDAGGTPFGSSRFDVGRRVVAPAVRGRGVGALEQSCLRTAIPIISVASASFSRTSAPTAIWEGVPVPRHAPLRDLLGAGPRPRGALAGAGRGSSFAAGAPVSASFTRQPDWERQRVRNDDSIVLESRLPGCRGCCSAMSVGTSSVYCCRSSHRRDIRILKVGHHGSRTSTSRELLEHWRPQIALISCGRGQDLRPSGPGVLRRLDAIGARVLRTDFHGQITIESDGAIRVTHVQWRKEMNHERHDTKDTDRNNLCTGVSVRFLSPGRRTQISTQK